MKKRFLWIAIFFTVGAVIIYLITIPKEEKWIYDLLPNEYVIEKKSNIKVVLKDKQIGIEDYIAEFCYGKQYIALKCLDANSDNINVKFYIIDTKNDELYGPYLDQETYEKVKEKIVDEELSNWIETITKPEGAKEQ